MSEKEKLLENLIEKSSKSKEEIEKLIVDKVNELSGLVSEEGAIYIVANELDIKLDAEKPKKTADLHKIEEITEPKTPTSLLCKVLRKYDKVTFSSSSGGEGSVQSVLVGDETGIIRIVFWNDKTPLLEQVNDSDVLKIHNAYTRENTNSNRIEIHYGPYSEIQINPEGETVEVKQMSGSIDFTAKKISEIEEGDRNIELDVTIADVDIPRFYLGCPQCFKKVFQDEDSQKCPEHGEVEATKVPIMNIIGDDGTGSLGLVAFRDRAEQLSKKTSEEIIGLTEDVDKYKLFSKQIIGAKAKLGGNVSTNNMTGEPQFLVNQVMEIELKEVSEEEIQEEKKQEASTMELDEDDLDIEEIDIDDDLL